MDYLNYGNKVEKKPSQKFSALQNSALKQPPQQEFISVKPNTPNIDLKQKVDMLILIEMNTNRSSMKKLQLINKLKNQ